MTVSIRSIPRVDQRARFCARLVKRLGRDRLHTSPTEQVTGCDVRLQHYWINLTRLGDPNVLDLPRRDAYLRVGCLHQTAGADHAAQRQAAALQYI